MPVLYESDDAQDQKTKGETQDERVVKENGGEELKEGEEHVEEEVREPVITTEDGVVEETTPVEGEFKRKEEDYAELMREEKQTKNPFSSFMVKPVDTRVEIQDREEKILLLLRRHFITNAGWILTALVMIVAPLLLRIVPLIDPLPARFQVAAILLWYLFTLGLMIEGFLSWYFNVYIVTDERVIDVDFLNLIYKNISAAKIEQIEDVTVRVTGAVRNVLGFGTVYIQTAAEKTQFEFEDVPQPQKVSKFLNEMMLEEEREKIEGRVR